MGIEIARRPWRVMPVSGGAEVLDATGEQVAAVYGLSDGEAQRHAALIAAAPDLHAALQSLLADTEDYERVNNLAPNPGWSHAWQSVTAAKAALAKAAGAAAVGFLAVLPAAPLGHLMRGWLL